VKKSTVTNILKVISFTILFGVLAVLSFYLGLSGLLISLAIIFGAVMVGFGADMLEMILPSGVAIAVVALLQICPEFFVEWATVKRAAVEPEFVHNAMANLYGANKLLVGFGPPLVFFVYYFFSKFKKTENIVFHEIKSYSIFVMIFAVAYNFILYLKNSLMWYDSIFLVIIYVASISFIGKMEVKYENTRMAKDNDELKDSEHGWLMRNVHSMCRRHGVLVPARVYLFTLLFLAIGGGLLVGYAEPFLECLLHAATVAGISTFFFIGYVAPFMSEFPEKIVAVGFAMKGREDTAMVNFLSSILSQLTLLTAMVPAAFSYYKGELTGITFDPVQSHELLLVIAMMLFSIMMFLDLKFTIRESILALGLFIWQFIYPESRSTVTAVYFVIFLSYFLEMVLEKRHTEVLKVISESVARPAAPEKKS